MISRYTYKDIVWTDLKNPTPEEVLHVGEESSLAKAVIHELSSESLRSKVEQFHDYLYLILHIPTLTDSGEIVGQTEIDFVVGKNFLITTSYGDSSILQQSAANFELSGIHDAVSPNGAVLFASALKDIYAHYADAMEIISEKINSIERAIFDGEEDMMVRRIALIRRELLDFEQAFRFHGDVLKSYEIASSLFFGSEYSVVTSSVRSEFYKLDKSIKNNRAVLSELQQTNDSLLSTKTNDIMRMFTILSFVMMPLTVITGIFSMNASFSFIQGIEDFLFVIGVMALIGIVLFTFFKHRKWL